MMFRFLLAGATALVSVPAIAADLAPPLPPMVPAVSPLSGYVEGYVGFGGGSWEWAEYEDFGAIFLGSGDNSESFSILGGAGRIAYARSPAFSVQFDAWYESLAWGGGSDLDPVMGLGLHGTWRSANYAFGGLISVGDFEAWDERLVNLAIEGAWYGVASSIHAQAGYTVMIQGDDETDDHSALYAHLVGTYFFTPNLALSGDIGVFSATASGDDGGAWTDDISGVRWGARLDYKLDHSPISLFAAYRGNAVNGDYSWDDGYYVGEWSGSAHTGLLGVRVNFGGETLQSLDRTVGFKDYNPVFGANAFAAD